MSVIPPDWKDHDRRLYLEIALKKKKEHALEYCCIGIGIQLFHRICSKYKVEELALKEREAYLQSHEDY